MSLPEINSNVFSHTKEWVIKDDNQTGVHQTNDPSAISCEVESSNTYSENYKMHTSLH